MHAGRLLSLGTPLLLPTALASAASPSAYVYVQTSNGVAAYSAAANGALTPVPGSPFKTTTGLIIGSTKTRFVTLGTNLVHTYTVASNGAIKAQVAQIDTRNYADSNCGAGYGTSGAVLDHSGKYLYVSLQYGSGNCGAIQTYDISSTGALAFNNASSVAQQGVGYTTLPSILGNEAYAYAISGYSHVSSITGYFRTTSGALNPMQFSETDPTLPGNYYAAGQVQASPVGNYLAVALYPGDTNPPQIASYTVDAKGNISSTNTATKMPYSKYDQPGLSFSPAGNLLALWADNAPTSDNGLQLFRFHGAGPLTSYKTLLNGTPIDGVGWDNANHLYAISTRNNKLFVFTVTSTSVTAAPGSPFSISHPTVLKVVSR